MSRLGPLSASHLVVTATLAALLLFVWPSLATAQLACGGALHRVPRRAVDGHAWFPPTRPTDYL